MKDALNPPQAQPLVRVRCDRVTTVLRQIAIKWKLSTDIDYLTI